MRNWFSRPEGRAQWLLLLAGLSGIGSAFVLDGCKSSCDLGSEGCECTTGGACNPGLTCLSGLCVNAGPNPNEQSDESDDNSTTPGDGDQGDGDQGDGDQGDGDGDGDQGDGDGDGPKLDMPEETDTDQPCSETGCKKVDLLFSLDGSLSMIEEINALKAGQAFLAITSTLESLNCGNIDYRIGVTDDNDHGWLTPDTWADPNPWFDSMDYTEAQISVHFQAAVSNVGVGGTPIGCEHVLTSAVNLLDGDTTGFLRDDALLVLVLVSDTDDLGIYDQPGQNTCGVGCQIAPTPVQTLYDTLVALKGGDPAGVSAIVVAGDPSVNDGLNFCGQPGSCGCGGLDCLALQADRLYEFVMLQTGSNGYAADICDGAAQVPAAVETALSDNIDLACQEFEPVG
jgi:hypothetical protein